VTDCTEQKSTHNCWPWLHNWSKWEDIEQGSVIHIKSQVIIGKYIVQERICAECNKKQLRTEKTLGEEL
jgi:hypothetical protein